MDMDDWNIFKHMPESYWLASTKKTNYPKLNEDIDTDIAIIGGGIVGILSAYQLEKEGFNITVLEAENIIESTTAHTTAKLTSQHSLIYDKIKTQMGEELARQYASANETAIHEFKKIADENNIDCNYLSQSAYLYTQNNKYINQIEKEVNTATSLGIKTNLIDEIPFPIDIKSGMIFENLAQFHPRKFLIPLAEKISKKGVNIYEQTRAIELNKRNDKYIINTTQGKKVSADKVIIASHYPFYNKKGMYYSRIYVEKSYILAIKAKEEFPGGIYVNVEDPS